MTTIDHRILIPAPPDVVWAYVSDITHNPDWQVDCTDVIFLTSRREGPGLRWRYATPGNHEMVVAVTAWYNGLGYEYYFVDGTSFRENKGRIRLQEIPEGTIVQWTFTYDMGGLLGGMRDSLGMKRQIDQTISESLKTLWQKIKQSGGGSRALEAKSLMREAPDVEARSVYQPRHPSVVEMGESEKPLRLASNRLKVEPPISEDDARPIPIFEEPPVVEDDTRPRSPFAPPAARKPEPEPEYEPDFLRELRDDERIEAAEPDFLDEIDVFDDELSPFEPPRELSDTQPRQQEFAAERTESLVDLRTLNEETERLQPQPTKAAPPEVAGASLPVSQVAEEPFISLDDEPETDGEDTPTQAGASFAPPTEAATASPTASIWEIFGVPRPSETQETAQVEPERDLPETTATAAEASVAHEEVIEALPDAAEPLRASAPEAEAAPIVSAAPETSVVKAIATSATQELPPAPTRVGLRVIQRRKSVRLRRP